MTPLRKLTGWNALLRFRRMLGLFAFALCLALWLRQPLSFRASVRHFGQVEHHQPQVRPALCGGRGEHAFAAAHVEQALVALQRVGVEDLVGSRVLLLAHQ